MQPPKMPEEHPERYRAWPFQLEASAQLLKGEAGKRPRRVPCAWHPGWAGCWALLLGASKSATGLGLPFSKMGQRSTAPGERRGARTPGRVLSGAPNTSTAAAETTGVQKFKDLVQRRARESAAGCRVPCRTSGAGARWHRADRSPGTRLGGGKQGAPQAAAQGRVGARGGAPRPCPAAGGLGREPPLRA